MEIKANGQIIFQTYEENESYTQVVIQKTSEEIEAYEFYEY